MKPAKLYKKLDNKKVRCTACQHKCLIKPEHTGICGIRKNINGQLQLLAYGRAIAANIDPIEKKPLFHFLPGSEVFSFGTVGCNFACAFCQNWDISQASKNNYGIFVENTGSDLQLEKIIEYCKKLKFSSIAYTYNEPTIFIEYAYDTAKLAHEHGIKNIFVSNGYGSDEAYEFIGPYLDAINIDLKSFNPKYYIKTCKAKLQPVLDNIKKIYDMGIWLELTTLVIPDKNDSTEELTQIAEFIKNIDPEIPWHVSRFFPQYNMSNIQPTPISTLIKAKDIGKQVGLHHVYVGNIIDIDLESTYCSECAEILIRRDGYTISTNNIQNGHCKYCQHSIKGVWQ